MAKQFVGHHLLRVRIRKKIFTDLKEIAEEQSERSGTHVTVSDLVRSACYNYILLQDSIRKLEVLRFIEQDIEEDIEEMEEEATVATLEELHDMEEYEEEVEEIEEEEEYEYGYEEPEVVEDEEEYEYEEEEVHTNTQKPTTRQRAPVDPRMRDKIVRFS